MCQINIIDNTQLLIRSPAINNTIITTTTATIYKTTTTTANVTVAKS
ncbi:hypothetical protein DOY81_007534 [Sarcophaga bullata]|nr:hypothetical protein DOY81_007534 [Sarcophaga bullata]